MDPDLRACVAGLDEAADHLDTAVRRVQQAQEVEWVSIFADRYRNELYEAILSLRALAARVASVREEAVALEWRAAA